MRNDRRPWERKKKQSHFERRRKESFCIFTEGKTEQLYFDDFNLPTLRVKCVGLGGGNAEHLLNEMLRYMNEDKYTGYDHYWLVFDCDDNSQEELQRVAARLKRSARERKTDIQWCFSNPCFECWYLLHFCYRDSPMTALELKRHLLREWIPGYHETMKGIYGLLVDKMETACRNASRLLPLEEREAWINRLKLTNPSTNVDDLVKMLRAEM